MSGAGSLAEAPAAPFPAVPAAAALPTLGEALRVWLRIGLLSFGGPAGQIALLHREVVEQAAREGRHVICEKPLALSAEDGAAMIRACERAGVRLFVAMVVRFFPQYLKAAELVHSGHIGSLQVMRLKRVGFPPHGGSSWFADDTLSGGVMVDMMLHDIDYALWLAGGVTQVYAKLTRTATRQYAQTVLTHDNGVITHIEGGWAYQPGLFRTGLDLAGTQGPLWTSSPA